MLPGMAKISMKDLRSKGPPPYSFALTRWVMDTVTTLRGWTFAP